MEPNPTSSVMQSPGAPTGVSQKINQLLVQKPIIMQLLRFVGIGVLNTALNFVILNLLSTAFHIDAGSKLGALSVIAFVVATFQSYYWNRHWAFSSGQDTLGIWKNFIRLVMVGLLGGLTFLAVLFGASQKAPVSMYVVILLIFGVAQMLLLHSFKMSSEQAQQRSQKELVTFWIVSAIGALINAGIITLLTKSLLFTPHNADLNKNIAAIFATAVSMVWNFIGYKLVVFKK